MSTLEAILNIVTLTAMFIYVDLLKDENYLNIGISAINIMVHLENVTL
jgi:hypothetical protein